MGGLVGLLIVAIAGLTIVAVMYIVLQEKHEHEEHFIPGVSDSAPAEPHAPRTSTMTIRPEADEQA